jgi:predicted phage tail protein
MQDFGALRSSAVQSDDVTPPSPVSGLAVVPAGVRRAIVTWAASTDDVGVEGYRVFVNGRLLGDTADRSFATPPLPDAVGLVMEVIAYDAAGNRSSPTASTTVVLADATPPPPVRRLGGTIGARTMQLSWARSPDPSGIAYYEVERDGAAPVRTQAQRLYVGRLQPNTWHTVRVRAVDRAGNSGQWVERRFRTR